MKRYYENVITLKKKIIEYRVLVKDSIFITQWIKRKMLWFVDEFTKQEWDLNNKQSAFHRVVVDHLKERHMIFYVNLNRWRYMYTDIYDDNEEV